MKFSFSFLATTLLTLTSTPFFAVLPVSAGYYVLNCSDNNCLSTTTCTGGTVSYRDQNCIGKCSCKWREPMPVASMVVAGSGSSGIAEPSDREMMMMMMAAASPMPGNNNNNNYHGSVGGGSAM